MAYLSLSPNNVLFSWQPQCANSMAKSRVSASWIFSIEIFVREFPFFLWKIQFIHNRRIFSDPCANNTSHSSIAVTTKTTGSKVFVCLFCLFILFYNNVIFLQKLRYNSCCIYHGNVYSVKVLWKSKLHMNVSIFFFLIGGGRRKEQSSHGWKIRLHSDPNMRQYSSC